MDNPVNSEINNKSDLWIWKSPSLSAPYPDSPSRKNHCQWLNIITSKKDVSPQNTSYILKQKWQSCAHAQPCLTLCDAMDCSPPGSSVHGILQARILEWVAISSSRGSSRSRDWTQAACVSCIAGGLYYWATWEAPVKFTYIWREKQLLSNTANPLICSILSHWLVLVNIPIFFSIWRVSNSLQTSFC